MGERTLNVAQFAEGAYRAMGTGTKVALDLYFAQGQFDPATAIKAFVDAGFKNVRFVPHGTGGLLLAERE